jgi:hypothetical protein
MATPYSGVSGGTKDAYNFYHSQLRINIECAFGQFVHRWGILRAAIPMGISIGKTTALVVALAKLHNFCMDNRDNNATDNIPSVTLDLDLNGAVELEFHGEAALVPTLVGGGHHRDDVPPIPRRRNEDTSLPRYRLHEVIVDNDLKRPSPNRRHS